jgi:hypothetical protein
MTSVSGPRFHDSNRHTQRILRSSHLFPVIFPCVHRHFSFSCHVVCASSGHRCTHRRTDKLINIIDF